MAEGEDADSIVNMLPKNIPLRMLLMAFVVSILFGISYIPWYLKDKKKA
jgi:hypothetical protein